MPDRPPPDPQDWLPPFRARWPWRGRHLQTLRNFLRRPGHPLPPARVLTFDMADGTGDRLVGALNGPEGAMPPRPLAVLLHGLTGCEDAAYLRATAAALLARGHPVLRLNLRGAGPSRPLCRELYHAGRSEDLRRVLSLLPEELAGRGVVLAGFSLGGNLLLKFLGEGDFPMPVLAAAAVSAPIDLAESSRRFLAPGNRVYHSWLLSRMKLDFLADPNLEARWRDAAREARSIYDFDNRIVGPRHGWSGAEEYYRVNSALRFMPHIRVPTLVVHALDDPWIPAGSYLSFDWKANPYLIPALSPGGGHVGFHGVGGVWHDRCLAVFLDRSRDQPALSSRAASIAP